MYSFYKFKKFLSVCVAACGVAILGSGASAMRFMKIIIVGNYESGKTELRKAFLNNEGFSEERKHTTDYEHYKKVMRYDDPAGPGPGDDVTVLVWDTAGEEKYHSLTKRFFRTANMAFITVDSTEMVKNNFSIPAFKQQFERWADETLDLSPGCRIVLVGTKCDTLSLFDKDRMAKILLDAANAINNKDGHLNHLAVSFLSSAKAERDRLRQDMEDCIKNYISTEGLDSLASRETFEKMRIQKFPILGQVSVEEEVPTEEDYYVTVGKWCCSSGSEERRTRVVMKKQTKTVTQVTGYEDKLVSTD